MSRSASGARAGMCGLAPVCGGLSCQSQVAARRPGPVSAFETIHQDSVVGKLTCFDRLIFKGHLTRFFPEDGMKVFLDSQGVLLKDFGPYARALSDKVKAHAQAVAEAAGRPYIYGNPESTTGGRGPSSSTLRSASRSGLRRHAG